MSSRFVPPDPETVRRAREVYDRQLSAEEFEAFVAGELSDDERAEKQSLIEWFTRRYPTAWERLAYNRRYLRGIARCSPKY